MKIHLLCITLLFCLLDQESFGQANSHQISLHVDQPKDVGPQSATFVGTIKNPSGIDPGFTTVFFDFSEEIRGVMGGINPPSNIAQHIYSYDGWTEVVFETSVRGLLNPNTEYTVTLYGHSRVAPGLVSEPLTFRTPPADWQHELLKTPGQPTYSSLPELRQGVTKVVVVTHGWQPSFFDIDVAWVDEMVAALNAYFEENSMDEWQTVAYLWVEGAKTSLPPTALANAHQEGFNLGHNLLNKKISQFHFIGHSAGSGLIQSACTVIKSESPDIVVHLTFLDPFTGFRNEQRDSYGSNADWSDNYFAYDEESSPASTRFTESLLAHAYNVDVTFLDENKHTRSVNVVAQDGTRQCEETVSSHRWPVDFYLRTVTDESFRVEANHFGFGLSREGGNWDTTSTLGVGNESATILGVPDMPCDALLQSSTPALLIPVITPEAVQLQSDTGVVEQLDAGFRMTTGSPAWVATLPSLANSVDAVTFEVAFTDASKEGLLSVFWDNTLLGRIDQRAVLPGAQEYTLPLPTRAIEGALSFRLDAFKEGIASVSINDPVLHEVPKDHLFNLTLTGFDEDRRPILRITGEAGAHYIIATSTDLFDWHVIAVVENIDGEVMFTDTTTDQGNARFYHALPH